MTGAFRRGFLSVLCLAAILPLKAADFSAWTQTLPITFTGYTQPQPLTNFPVLVTLGAAIPGFTYASFGSPADGADLRFTADNQMDELNYEIEKWATNGASAVWVQVPVLSGTNTRVWAFWGNAAAGVATGAASGAAWGPEFRGVWHMRQTNVVDSTTNANNGLGKNGIITTNTGAAGDALFLNPLATSSNYVDFGTGLKLGTNSATLSIWFRTPSNIVQAGLIGKSVYGGAERFSLNCAKNPNLLNAIAQTTNSPAVLATTNTPWVSGYYDDKWHQATAIFNRAGYLALYVDGVQKSVTNFNPITTANMVNTNRFFIGAYGNATGAGVQTNFFFQGALDEGRLMSVPASSNWVWAAWLNTASNAAFNSYGTAGAVTLTVQSRPATGVGATTATLNGLVVFNGGIPETEAAFCWDTADRGTGSTGAWAYAAGAGSSFTNGQSVALTSAFLSGSTYVYRCYATNAGGEAWSAPQVFQTIYLPTVVNRGPVNGYTNTWLRGEIADTGLDTPAAWFAWWKAGDTVTNLVPMGLQNGAFSNAVSGLAPFENYEYAILASNLAGTVWTTSAVFRTLITYADVITYSGSATGRWENAGNWDMLYVPTPGNTVIIPARKTVTMDGNATIASLLVSTGAVLSVAGTNVTMHWRGPLDTNRTDWVGLAVTGNVTLAGGSLAIGGLNQKCPSYLAVGGNLALSNCPSTATNVLVVYAGPTNAVLAYSNGGARVTVAGTTLVGSNSWVYPYCHQITGAPVVFDLQDLAVTAVNAGFDALGRGYSLVGATYYGPGVDTSGNYKGGSYGGLGGNATATKTNGFAFAPFRPGSPGYLSTTAMGMGGGAIRILARAVTLNGRLNADGQPYNGNNTGAGSGGGIWVTCSNFTAGASASVSARGADDTQQGAAGGGGGGRIAIMTDSPTGAQLASLYASGTCASLIVVTTNMADPVLSPYPTLVNVAGGINSDNWSVWPYAAHGKPGTAVWLRNKGDDFQVTISGSPSPMSVSPAYGVHKKPAGDLVCSAVSPGFVSPTNAFSRLTCTGYAWSNAAAAQDSGSATSVTIDVTADTWLTWTWGGLEHKLTVRSGGKGSVLPDYQDWYTNGAAATLTAQPDSGCSFLYWVGDVPYADRASNPLVLTMSQPRSVIACFSAPPAGARALTWNGGLFTNDWFNPVFWDSAAIPGLYDDVTITNGTNLILFPADVAVASLTIARNGRLFVGGTGSASTSLTPVNSLDARPYSLTTAGSLTLTNGGQMALGGLNPSNRVTLAVGGNLLLSNTAALVVYAGYTGPTTDVATYQTGGAGVTVGGMTVLGTNCWIHPFCHQISGAPVIFNLQDLVIATNAGFNADYKGFGRITTVEPSGNWVLRNYGPGRVVTLTQRFTTKAGGSYGGLGGGNSASSVYGYTNAPYWPGSPHFDDLLDYYSLWAGGAIRIQAKQVQLNGQLLARGIAQRSYQGASSGGGIWVTCERFATGPLATMNASGGSVYSYGNNQGGGGGRIAVAVGLSAKQIADLYAAGTARDLVVRPMTNSPFAANFSVAGGSSYGTGIAGAAGSAVYVTSEANPGTLIMIR